MKRIFKSLFIFVKINPLLYLILFIFSVLSEFVPLMVGLLIRHIFNALQMNQIQEFFIFAILFSLVLLGQQFMQYQYGMIDVKITFETDKFYIFNTLNKIMVLGKKISIGTVMNILNIDLQQINYQGMSIIDLLSKIIFLVSAMIVMFLNHQLITVAVIIPFMVGNVLLLIGERQYLNYYTTQREASLDYFSFFHSLIDNTKHHRYLDTTCLYQQLGVLNNPVQNEALKKEVYLQVIRSGIVLLNHLVIILLIILGWKEGLSLGDMLLFITYVSSAFNLQLLFNTVLNNQSQLKFFEEKFEAIESEISNISQELTDKPIDNDELFQKISTQINLLKPGNILQIKTNEAEKLYTMITSLQYDIGFVASELQLFDESVDMNLTLFASHPLSEAEINNALESSKFPLSKKKLSTIGSNGMKLSAGERQRLAIARALVAGNLIIMDMSFENIDFSTKIDIINGLKLLNKSYVIISNDTQIEKYSDYVITESL